MDLLIGGGVIDLSGGIGTGGVLDLGSDGVLERPGGIGPGGIPIIGFGDLVLGSTFSRVGRVIVGFGRGGEIVLAFVFCLGGLFILSNAALKRWRFDCNFFSFSNSVSSKVLYFLTRSYSNSISLVLSKAFFFLL